LKKLLLCIACALAILPAAYAQGYLTLEEAIRTGLENNYAIRVAEQNQVIAENTFSLGEAGLLPTLDATAGKNWSRQDVEQRFRNEPEPVIRDDARSSSASSSLVADYTLNLGGIFAFKQLGTLSEISKLEAKVTIENTLAAIATAYYRIVLEQQRYDLLQNTLELSEERRRISKDRYELGRASKQEFLAAQVDYNTDLTALINQEEVIASARIRLNELMGENPRQSMTVKDTITIETELNLDDLLTATNLENPGLMVAQRQVNAAHLQMQELRAQRLPQLSLFGSYNRQLNQAEAGIFLSNQSVGFNYGVGASWNLFNGFVLHRRIQNARVRENIQQIEYQALELELETDVNEIYVSYRNNLRLLEVARSNYAVAEENADIALERYKLGNTSSLEFREAQQNALAAQSRLINVLFTIKEGEIELQRLAGTVLSGF
jgi:outer membrane protein